LKNCVNTTILGNVNVEGAEKASKIGKTGLSGADISVGTSYTLEDLSYFLRFHKL
jgi:hypothetical protein